MPIHFSPWLLVLIPALPLIGFLMNAGLALFQARKKCSCPEWFISSIGSSLPLASFIISVVAFLLLKANPSQPLTTGVLFPWLITDMVQVDFSLMVDPLTSVMILIITGVGTLIHIYSIGYMKGDSGFARYFAYLNLFLFFMLVLVMGDNLLVLFVGWEGVGLCSYLLIGFWFTDAEKASAGKKAFIVNRIGDFGFLIGIFFILYAFASQSHSSELSFLNYQFMRDHKEIFSPFAVVITLCLFAGAVGKSAQIPLYVWLPDAMAGPTPVSALIHAATMVTAGIYMVAKLFFLFEMAPLTLTVIASIGLATSLMAALIGLTQVDIKKVLAYSTVSQLGYMFLALGVGAPVAAVFHLMTHAFFKACLFLCAGSVIHAVHNQDIRNMGGLMKKMPITGATFFISTLAIAGIPPFAGFFSKDEILWMTFLHESRAFYLTALITAGITAFYMFRLFTYTFLGKTRHSYPDSIHESPKVMTYPLMILAFLAIVGGFIGFPEGLNGSNYFHHWLGELSSIQKTESGNHHFELALMGVSAGWALFMSLLSLGLYWRNLQWTTGIKRRIAWLYQLVSDKFRVDEFYKTCLVNPLVKISRTLLWKGADEKIIDGLLVHGWSDMSFFSARLVSACQTGLTSHYLLFIWIGLIAFLVAAVR